MAKSKKIKVELIDSTDVKKVDDIKQKQKATEKINDNGAETPENNSSQPDKKIKKKKADYLREGQMPPANRLLPAITILILLVAMYTGFNTLFVPGDADFMEDRTSTTGWQSHVAELKKENERQQAQLNQLKGQIKVHDGIIAEQGKKINEQTGKIKKNKQELDKVTKELDDFENKTGEELKNLLKKKNELSDRQEKLENEMSEMKKTDKLLRDDVEQLKNQTKQFEELFEKFSGDMKRSAEERQAMRKQIEELQNKYDKLSDLLRKQGLIVPEDEPEERNQP